MQSIERNKMNKPSVDEWLSEAKAEKDAGKIGMYLVHNGVVRETPRSVVRDGAEEQASVVGMEFSYDRDLTEKYLVETKSMPGIFYVRLWLNEGTLKTGDDLMQILVGGDIRPHVMEALDYLIEKIKSECVTEREII